MSSIKKAAAINRLLRAVAAEMSESPETQAAAEAVRVEFADLLDHTAIFNVWTIEDIGPDDGRLTDDDRKVILVMLEREHDASLGINNSTIESAIDRYLRGNGEV